MLLMILGKSFPFYFRDSGLKMLLVLVSLEFAFDFLLFPNEIAIACFRS